MAVTAERMPAISWLISTPVRLNNKGRKTIEKNHIFLLNITQQSLLER